MAGHQLSGLELFLALLITTLGGWIGALIVLIYSLARLVRQRDLTDIVGTWRKDPAFGSAIAAQDTVDDEIWR